MKSFWKSIAFFAIANMLALTAAQALEIDETLQFRAPQIGCLNFNDAVQELRTRRVGALFSGDPAAFLESELQYRGLSGNCVVLNNPSTEFRIVDKRRTQYSGPDHAYFCLKLANASIPNPFCVWVYLSERGQR
jgi:hypothetical protein